MQNKPVRRIFFALLLITSASLCIAQPPVSTPTPATTPLSEQQQILQKIDEDNRRERQKIENSSAIEELQTLSRTKTIMQGLLFGSGLTAGGLLALVLATIWTNRRSSKELTPHETLLEYHRQALNELKLNSFISLMVSLFGLTIIFTGAVLALSNMTSVGAASAIAGALTEAVSYLFYRQTNTIRNRVRDIEDQLFRFTLAESLEKTSTQDSAKTRLLEAEISGSIQRRQIAQVVKSGQRKLVLSDDI
jgi:hypothetical protein